MAMVSSRDRPRERARGAQRTYRGGGGCLRGKGRRRGVAGRSLAPLPLLCLLKVRVEVDAGGAPLARCAVHTLENVPIAGRTRARLPGSRVNAEAPRIGPDQRSAVMMFARTPEGDILTDALIDLELELIQSHMAQKPVAAE